MTSAQRTNARQDKIWEKAMALRQAQSFSNAEVHEALKLKDEEIHKLTQQRDALLDFAREIRCWLTDPDLSPSVVEAYRHDAEIAIAKAEGRAE